jgi:hypothetical protein
VTPTDKDPWSIAHSVLHAPDGFGPEAIELSIAPTRDGKLQLQGYRNRLGTVYNSQPAGNDE